MPCALLAKLPTSSKRFRVKSFQASNNEMLLLYYANAFIFKWFINQTEYWLFQMILKWWKKANLIFLIYYSCSHLKIVDKLVGKAIRFQTFCWQAAIIYAGIICNGWTWQNLSLHIIFTTSVNDWHVHWNKVLDAVWLSFLLSGFCDVDSRKTEQHRSF